MHSMQAIQPKNVHVGYLNFIVIQSLTCAIRTYKLVNGDGFIYKYRVLRIFIISLPYFIFRHVALSTDF